MQFRAGAIYTVLFLVVAAGAYGVIATAESPDVTIDEADADHQLEVGDDFTVNDRTYNVSELTADSGTLEYVNDSAILEVEWDDGGTVQLEEGEEYTVMINQPEEAEEEDDEADDEEADDAEDEENGEEADDAEEENGEEADDENGEEADDAEDENGEEADEADDGENGEEADDGEDAEEADDEEAQPESFTLIEDYDEDEYQVEQFEEEDDRLYVIVDDDDGERTAIPVEEFEEFDAQTYEVGDSIEFFEEESEMMVEGEVVDLSTETVTVEYEGEEVTEFDLEHGQVATIDNEEFGVYFPSEEQVYLTEDVESFEQQQADVEEHHERVHGLWWVVVLSLVTVSLIAGLAFMPVRG